MTPFRSEKNTNWEGAFRIPLVVRWPGKIKAGSISNEIVQHHDWFPTFLAMAGDPDVMEKLKKGYKAIGRTYKNHIDGFNLLPYLTGKEERVRARSSCTSATTATSWACATTTGRWCSWSSAAKGTLQVWAEPFTRCAWPSSSTCARTPTSSRTSHRTRTTSGSCTTPTSSTAAMTLAQKFADTFKEFPIIQKPNTFTIDDAVG